MISSVKRHSSTLWALAALLTLTVVFMLPRFRSAQFGLLDDGVHLVIAENISHRPQDAFTMLKGAGRYIPGYWLSINLILRLAGMSPLGGYIGSWVWLLGVVWGVFLFLRWRGASNLQAFLVGVLYCLSASTVESHYTISKSEPMLLFWTFAGLLIISAAMRLRNERLRYSLILLTIVCFWLAFIMKETAIVFVGIAFVWMLLAWLWKSRPLDDGMNFVSARIIFFSALFAGALWIISRNYFIGGSQQGYAANYKISATIISEQVWKWVGYLLRDYFYLLPLSLTLMLSPIRKRINTRLVLDFLAWMAAWGIILLPWQALDSYYTLPFTLGVSIIGGLIMGAVFQFLFVKVSKLDQKERHRIWQSVWVGLCLTGSLVLFAIVLVNNTTMARLQLLYDKTNQKMVQTLSRSPQDSLILFNTPEFEYVFETRLHLANIYQRPDLLVSVLDYPRPPSDQIFHFRVVNPVVNNIPMPSVRSSLQNEPGVEHWDACFKAFLAPQSFSHKKIIDRMKWVDIGLNRFLLRIGLPDALSIHRYESVFTHKTMKYGWEIYDLQIDPWQISQPGVFASGSWKLQLPNGERAISDFGQPDDLPLTGDFDGNGWSDIGLFRPGTGQFFLDTNLDGEADNEIQLTGMQLGDQPLVGDWDGDGVDTLGFFRPSDATWNLRDQNTSGEIDLRLFFIGADPKAIPLAGDWDGDSMDTLGMYLPDEGLVIYSNNLQADQGFSQRYNVAKNAVPVPADWYGFGKDTLATVSDGQWLVHPNNQPCNFPNLLQPFSFGQHSDAPVAGRWRAP